MKVPPMVPSAEERLDAEPCQFQTAGTPQETRRLFLDTGVIRLQEHAHRDGYAAGFAAALGMLREPSAALIEACDVRDYARNMRGDNTAMTLRAAASVLANIAEKDAE